MPQGDGVDGDEEVVRVVEDLEVVAPYLIVREDAQEYKGEERRDSRERHRPIIRTPPVRLGLTVRRVVHRYLQHILREDMQCGVYFIPAQSVDDE